MDPTTIAAQRLCLAHGADRLVLDTRGGLVIAWHRGDQCLMGRSPMSAQARVDPLDSGAFPLIPYSNRIDHGRFTWAGQTFALDGNFAPEPHAIHGLGWTTQWRIGAHSADRACMALDHTPDTGWPWPFEAEQDFRLDGDGLLLTLRLRNRADVAVPAGLGHHPYFDATGARLRFAAQTVWHNGPDGLPEMGEAPADIHDFSGGAPVRGRVIDQCYQGWNGAARIEWTGRRWALAIAASAELPCAVVCIPASGEAFCFEPASHANDAINRPALAPMATLEPGETLAAHIRYAVVPAGG